MKAKALEVRDSGTFIPMLCVEMNPRGDEEAYQAQRWLLRRCGYPCDGSPNIIMTQLTGAGKATNDPYEWGGRTYPVAHNYIIEHWDELHDGDVVDVEFILGETAVRKVSERLG